MKHFIFIFLFSFQTWALDAEIKISVNPNQLSKILAALDADEEDVKKASIYFFDTKERELNQQGLILRARQRGNNSDLTVKIRPCENDELQQELDYSALTQVLSCGVDADVDSSEIKNAVVGNISIKKLYPKELENVAEENADLNWSDLEIIGPIASKKWKSDEVAVELWSFKGKTFLEISKKVDSIDAADELNDLTSFAIKNSIQILPGFNKTTWALKL